MKVATLTIAGVVLASAAQAEPRIVNRICSGLPNRTCIANCDQGQFALSIAAAVTKNGITAWEAMAPTSGRGVTFITPNLTYDQFTIRLICEKK